MLLLSSIEVIVSPLGLKPIILPPCSMVLRSFPSKLQILIVLSLLPEEAKVFPLGLKWTPPPTSLRVWSSLPDVLQSLIPSTSAEASICP